MVTLADLGILRDVREDAGAGGRDDHADLLGLPRDGRDPRRPAARAAAGRLRRRRGAHRAAPGLDHRLDHREGRRKLAAAGIAPPGPAPRRAAGPVPLVLGPRRRAVACPRAARPDTELIAAFSATACRALRRCPACREPFEHVKEI